MSRISVTLPSSSRSFLSSIALAVLTLVLATAARGSDERAGAWREPASTVVPPASMQARDLDRVLPPLPGVPVPTDPRDGTTREEAPSDDRAVRSLLARTTINGYEEIGGDDVVFSEVRYIADTQIDVASNGDIYLAVGDDPDVLFTEYFTVYRSTDGGESFDAIGTFTSPGNDYDRLYELDVVEGIVDRVFVTYMHYDSAAGGFDMRVAYAALGVASPIWQVRTVMDVPGVSFLGPDIATDVVAFDDFYVYAVCAGLDGNGDDIWFARSTDQGSTWSAPVRIASLSSSGNLMYSTPRIEYGAGGELHLAYRYTERLQSTFDDGILYRKATNYGASLADWSVNPVWTLRATTDGIDQYLRGVAVDGAADRVVVTFTEVGSASPKVYQSANGGDSWIFTGVHAVPLLRASESVIHGGRLYVVGTVEGGPDSTDPNAFTSAPLTDLSNWSAPLWFGEYPTWFGGRPSIAIDPTRALGVVFAYTANTPDADHQPAFDAAWRGGPGYPNYEDGFPIDVPGGGSGERTPPALADVDGDGQQEIVFANRDGTVYVIEPHGSIAPGWPVDVGQVGWRRTPAAVGDLNGDGVLEIVVGNTLGQVFSFAPDGTLNPGFPADLGTGVTTYVAIGAVGPPYPRWIVALSGNEQARINYRGAVEFKSGTLLGQATGTPAIGDVDGDGDPEIVYAFDRDGGGGGIQVLEGDLLEGVQAFRAIPETVSDGLSMTDLDLDGDLEIMVPTDQGRLYVLHHDLTDVAGFPYDDPTGTALTRVALDQFLGTSPPEMVFAARDNKVTVLYGNGTVQASYPASTTSGWFVWGGPIMTSVATTSGNYVVIGSRDQKAWSFRNVGALPGPGWPKDLRDPVEVSPAAGDIDGDGNDEIVFLGNAKLHVIDVGLGGNPANEWWRMDGGDPARTGCANCDEEIVTAVDGASVSTRLGFRLGSANPASSEAAFSFSLARNAVVELQVFDLRGRSVRRVTRTELGPGTHRLVFDGRDHDGRELASGTYVARLRVRSSEGERFASQKFAWVE